MQSKTRNRVFPLAITAVMAAVIAVVSPFAIPIGPVPISLSTLAIYLCVYVLGWKRGSVATLVYVLLGAAGMPVFSGFSGGLGKMMGPTGGYIIGYLPMALVAGWLIQRFYHSRGMQLMALVLATAILYAVGTAWFCVQGGYALGAALGMCVLPFIPGDLVKIAIALFVGPMLRRQLERAGLPLAD